MGSENKSSVLMQKYELGKLLGQGNFAKVYHARNLKTSHSVAIKVFEKEKITNAGMIDQIKREISIMKMVKHPNVVELYEVMASKNKIYFVMEYIRNGELFGKVCKGKLKEEVSRKFFQQLISAMDFCHSRGVFHRDLKPENLLLDEDGNLKISDFGLSALVNSRRQDGLLHTACGTPAYVAPEVISRRGYEGAKADIWSCGVILFVLMAGHLPFNDQNLMELYRKIGKAEFKFPGWFSSDVRRLLSRILDPNPSTRISIQRILENSWFRKGFKFNHKLMMKTSESTNQVAVSKDVEEVFDLGEEGKPPLLIKPTNMNAFDIISLSVGFDLSLMFEPIEKRKETRFTTTHTPLTIISKIEEIAEKMKLKIKKNGGGTVKMEGAKQGRKGVLAIDAEIYEVAPDFHLVEIKKVDGDTLEYQRLWKQDMRPSLQEIVWAWQGDQKMKEQV